MNVTDQFKEELETQIKANRSLIYLVTHEEERFKEVIQKISSENSWSFVFWDIASKPITNNDDFYTQLKEPLDQIAILNWFLKLIETDPKTYYVLVLNDFHRLLAPDGHPGQVELETIRLLKNLIEHCHIKRKCVIITGPKFYVPLELTKVVSIIDCPLPDRSLITDKINQLLKIVGKKFKNFRTEYSNNELESITSAFLGLTMKEIELICAYTFRTEKEFLPAKVASKKRDIIKQSGILEWIDTEFGLSEVGGLHNLKNWLNKRKDAFTEDARSYGLPEPKGLLIIGIQGAGKSQVSKAIAEYWSLPLLRLDIGKVFSGIVGSSEENLRSVIKTAESVAPCILWCDEIDKAFGNTGFSGDSGTSARILGTFLTWMQEKKSPVFVVATANVVANLPPELMRKGRFDDIFFVDLPDDEERQEIWSIHFKKRGYSPENFMMNELIEMSKGYTGAEIESAIIASMFEAYSDGKRKISTKDLKKELKDSVPIYITMKEKIEALRVWAKTRARNASKSSEPVVLSLKQTESDVCIKEEEDL